MTREHVLPDPSTRFGKLVRRRLAEEEVVWLTTVNAAGVPQPNPVWFLWQPDEGDEWGDGSFLIYHLNTAARLRSLTERPTVALNFNGGEETVAVVTGVVEVLQDHPTAGEVPGFAAKYAGPVARLDPGKSVAEMMAPYSVVTRIRPVKVRGF